MNWGAFDLNLLIVFDAVMQDRSVTRAGSRIGLSQPAMSHALNRLRHMLKDELFVRTPDGMVPTPRAEALAQPLRNALSEMQLALEPAAFDPAAADRRFTLAVNNYAAVVLAPPLVAAVSAAAPAVRLDLRPSGDSVLGPTVHALRFVALQEQLFFARTVGGLDVQIHLAAATGTEGDVLAVGGVTRNGDLKTVEGASYGDWVENGLRGSRV